MIQQVFNDLFRKSTKHRALEIIRITDIKKYSDALVIMRKQLIRSVISTAANFRAVCRARSQNEKFSKLCTVVEEADETLFWIEMLGESDNFTHEEFDHSAKEAEEILKVMSAYKNKLNKDN